MISVNVVHPGKPQRVGNELQPLRDPEVSAWENQRNLALWYILREKRAECDNPLIRSHVSYEKITSFHIRKCLTNRNYYAILCVS